MRRRPILTHLDRLAERSDECRADLLRDSYRELAAEVRELWPQSPDPDPLAPRLSKRLALLETLSGHTPPDGVLSARDVLAIAKRRSLL